MSPIKSRLLLSAVLFLVYVPLASATVTYQVGICLGPAVTSFGTISAALAATPAPDVVKVCPGPYPEQVVITNPVTLEGISVNGSDQALIVVPSGGLNTNTTFLVEPAAAQIFVNNATGPVNITNIAVDGDGNGLSPGDYVIGVLYLNSSGKVDRLETRYQTGTDRGIGVLLEGGSATPAVTIENSNMHDFDDYGIYAESFSGPLTAQVEGNTVIASHAEAGISVFESAPTVSHNFVSGPSSGLFGAGIVVAQNSGSISENTITGSELGILIYGGGVSVTSNKIYDISVDGIDLHSTSATVQGNTITQAHDGINFECFVDDNVSSNTISVIHSTGLINVPAAVVTSNTFYDVPAVSSVGSCAD